MTILRGRSVDAGVDEDEHTVRVARRRFARRQRARRLLAWRRVVTLLAVMGLLVTAVWLVFFSSVLAVRGVTVVGTDVLTQAQVRRAARAPIGRPLATVDLKAIQARVENLAPVASVDVTRTWPDHLRISVTERTAVAVVQSGGELKGLDPDGVLFRTYPHRPAGLPLLHLSAAPGRPALAEAARVAAALPGSLARRVDYVEVATVDRIWLQLKNGRRVLWGSAESSAQKAQVLAVLLRHRDSYYDVSVPGQPIVRP